VELREYHWDEVSSDCSSAEASLGNYLSNYGG
jgi:hypothetical protein